eukprot:TRINITY_DN151_c0_g1_i3.p1 TRINITY_DN151_c0_g1~~TRINITY_DN151_c0_g1_i3.p1  ORF type:complete len:260 (+),score=59.20 TRINITY_DN151_c0_g1_i3:528-1307(+)
MRRKKRKKRKKKKKNKRKRQDQPKKVTAFQKTYKDDLGREIVRKAHTVDLQVADRELLRGAEMSTVNKSYGSSQQDLAAYEDNRAATGSVYQPSFQDNTAYQPEGHTVITPGAPPPVISKPPPMAPTGASSPPRAPMQAPPPKPGAGPPRAPQQAYQQPVYNQQQAYQPPPTPAAPPQPQMPESLAKYAKMMKLRVPIPAIKNKMRADKVDVALFDQWLDPSGPKGSGAAPPPAPGAARPPPNPSGGSGPPLRDLPQVV